ncbi:MAG TPA: DUF4430 domain-containing protein [Verrucomicrobiae bacterium]|nr:DUF4430 domain-containing protein [Verrucomicrobiae bacterium]
MRNKNIALVAALVILLGGVSAFAYNKQSDSAKPEATPTASATPVQSEIVTFDGEEGKAALVTLKAKYTVETKSTSYGEMVQGINGLVADDAHYWGFYVNGGYAQVGAADYTAKAGDKIEFRYEKL